ncbi:VOC family protein [Frankia sp. CNm7]|uniref:VOC family protein n=1 Tax=Frankia nepalensis TaxID=1836974 RepID=A0A937RIS9_9ACTN|nr:VOC family protein [Frankia nepalensis]MBL7502661.1 VOC family protein [Frankia nepalensis]MBL7514887.1 VOC family protein [Frankia nepalensis]MBL7524614.1 VOC family protein [Frankia nepalensis]MBL7633033.1 VOC family protein [Frankia nepalensis]
MVAAQITLIVLYCSDLSACRDFYRSLGLAFERERHGSGLEHYAATLSGGAVLELYPAGSRGETGRIRLGLTASQGEMGIFLEPGDHILRDPEGRVVDIHVTS